MDKIIYNFFSMLDKLGDCIDNLFKKKRKK